MNRFASVTKPLMWFTALALPLLWRDAVGRTRSWAEALPVVVVGSSQALYVLSRDPRYPQ